MKTTMTKLAAIVALAVAGISTSQAQTNLGAACGCPSVASRPTVLMSALPGYNATTGELDNGAVLNCATTYVLDTKIYVPSGKTISIAPGTVIKGRIAGTAANATALIIERGGKIIADGSADCPIVFTAEADLLDGAYPIANKGQWGGLVMLGKATNNLTLAANGPFQALVGDGRLCVANGLGTIEGFASSNSKDQFGVNLSLGETFDDNDNSGILRYVSVRFSGANLVVGSEINGISLGSVGRGTIIEHVDIISCADDGIEFFGGTVNIKYCSLMFGNDDMFDWDDGYSGKVQFVFGLKTDNTASVDADNGFEMDADDQKSNLLPRSHPVIYNVTMIGNSKTALTSDNSGLAAIEAKEYTEGEIYNSVFANFRYGLNLIKATGTRTGGFEAYHNWSTASGNGSSALKIKCNTFVGTTVALALDKNNATAASATDLTQFNTTDLNVTAATIPGFSFNLGINNTTNAITTQIDAVPTPALSTTGCPVAPVDGFFVPASYRGAFASSGKSWLSDWSYAAALAVTAGLQPCPTDINQDGITDNIDFLQLLGQFNLNCN